MKKTNQFAPRRGPKQKHDYSVILLSEIIEKDGVRVMSQKPYITTDKQFVGSARAWGKKNGFMISVEKIVNVDGDKEVETYHVYRVKRETK